MSKTKSLLTIVGSIVILGAALVSSLRSEEEIVERKKRPDTAEVIYNKKEKVKVTSEDGTETKEDLNVQLDVDDENNNICLEVQTQNFNNPEWKAEAMQFNRFTRINEGWSRVYIIHPENISVSSSEQLGYAVPKHQWIRLIPAEEDETCKVIQKQGKTLITEATGLLIPFPGSDKTMGRFIDSKRKEKDSAQKALEDLTQKGYLVTRIEGNVQQNVSSNLTARVYEIELDMDQIENSKTISMYLWARTALGDPSIAPDGMSQNRYGTHERMFPFTMTGKKGIPKGDMKVYSKILREENKGVNFEIFIEINGKEKRLTTNPETDADPVLSPNKTQIAFTSESGRTYAIYTMNLDGTGKEKNNEHWIQPQKTKVVKR